MASWTATITFETPETQPPDTVKCPVEAGSPSTAAARAVRMAQKFRPGKRFESLVILLERAGKDKLT